MRYLVLLFILVFEGCSTPSPELDFTSGVEAQQVTADTYRIVAHGTSGTAIQDATLLKAAETTRSLGGTHFAIITAADAQRSGANVSPGQSTTAIIGNTAITTFSPETAHNYIKPGQDTYIRVLRFAPDQTVPGGALSADEVIEVVGARVKRG